MVLGGAKVTDKVALIDRFLDTADTLLIGGAMCFSFFRAQGRSTGDSLVEEEGVELARAALAKSESSNCRLLLPVDLVLGDRFGADAEVRPLEGTDVPDGWMGLDVGPRTIAAYAAVLERAGTVFWNGPMGAFELEPFAAGTRAVAEAVAAASGHHGGGRGRLRRGDRLVRAGRTAWTTCPPAAAPRSSCSRDATCPGWRRSTMPSSGRRPYVAGNWKMWGTRAQAAAYCDRLPGLLPGRGLADRRTWGSACPSRRSTCACRSCRAPGCWCSPRTCIRSPRAPTPARCRRAMLVELGVDGVVLGHSERRLYNGETDQRAPGEGAGCARGRAAADPLRR